MANIHGIEVSGETYDLEDSNARQGVQTNANDIDGIEGKIPDAASSSNKFATQNDISELDSDITARLAVSDITPTAGEGVTITQNTSKRQLNIITISLVVTCNQDRLEGFTLATLPVAPSEQIQCACSGEGRAAIRANGTLILDSDLRANDSMRVTGTFII